MERDCHSKWHDPVFDDLRSLWVVEKTDKRADERALRSEKKQIPATIQTASGPSAVSSSEPATIQTASGPSARSSSEPATIQTASGPSAVSSSERESHVGHGRPRGSINRRRRRGNYISITCM